MMNKTNQTLAIFTIMIFALGSLSVNEAFADLSIPSFDISTKTISIPYEYNVNSCGFSAFLGTSSNTFVFLDENGINQNIDYSASNSKIDISCKGTINVTLDFSTYLVFNFYEVKNAVTPSFNVIDIVKISYEDKQNSFGLKWVCGNSWKSTGYDLYIALNEYFLVSPDNNLNNYNDCIEKYSTNTPSLIITEHKKKNGGGCNDCTPPTLNFNSEGESKVKGGITINDFTTDADYFHTQLIQHTSLGVDNNITLKYFENGGAHNIKLMQIGSVKEIGTPLSASQWLIEIWMGYFADDIENPIIKEINIIDPQGIINVQNTSVALADCDETDNIQDKKCLEVSMDYSYVKVPNSFVIVAEAFDYNRNSQRNYFNDGFNVTDPNPAAPQEVEIYKYQCNDPALDTIMNGGDRNNCHWRAEKMPHLWK